MHGGNYLTAFGQHLSPVSVFLHDKQNNNIPVFYLNYIIILTVTQLAAHNH